MGRQAWFRQNACSEKHGALLHKGIGDQLTCVFVDHGLLRLNEGDDGVRIFAKKLGVKVIRVNAADRYCTALKGVVDPEAKRKITDVDFLAQGTIYPDVIESAGGRTGKARVIKSHHNVGGAAGAHAIEVGGAPARAVQG